MGNREDLLVSAKQCLFEKGYANTTVRDIASKAGVSMAAIGYHFGSKEALLNEALFIALDEGAADVGLMLADGDEADLEARWARLIASFTAHRTFWIANIEAVLMAFRSSQLQEQLSAGQQQGRSGAAAQLTGVDEANVDPSVVRSLGSVQLALISGLVMQWLIDPDQAPSPSEVVAGIRQLGKLM